LPFLKNSPPFPIGVFHAFSKPTSSNAFLLDFISEAEEIDEIGLSFQGKYFPVKIKAFICDAPARAMILCIKGHSSERYGCARCTGFGTFLGELRTNVSFRNKQCVAHHHCRSILENLNYLDMVKDIPIDPMHLLDLGVMKKILAFIFGTDQKKRNIRNVTLHHTTVALVDSFITKATSGIYFKNRICENPSVDQRTSSLEGLRIQNFSSFPWSCNFLEVSLPCIL
jgi:hypothetical protein